MNQNNKIVFLINSLRGGGAERICTTLANGLAERDWEVRLIVLNLRDAVLQNELDARIKLTNLGVAHARTSFLKIAKYLLREKPEKILVFNHQLAVLLVVLRIIFHLKLKIIARNISTLSKKNLCEKSLWHKHIVNWMTQKLYSRVNKIIAQSQGMRDDLINCYHVDSGKITVIYNPVDPKIEILADEQDFSKTEKQDYLLCVGRLESAKAIHYAINAFSKIADNYPQMQLRIAGKGSLESELKALARELGVSERVHFEGYQKNMIPYYLYAKATILTSLYEGFPNVLVESIALGTPVVTFDCPSGPSEIVQDGINGYLVEYKNEIEFAVYLEKVLADDFQYGRIRATANRFSSESIIQKYECELSK